MSKKRRLFSEYPKAEETPSEKRKTENLKLTTENGRIPAFSDFTFQFSVCTKKVFRPFTLNLPDAIRLTAST